MNLIAKWMTATTRACVVCALTIVFVSTALPGEEVEARSVSYQLNIPAENLEAGLQALALASHHKLLYRAELVSGKTGHALIGTFTTEEAMRLLLSGTNLDFAITPAAVVLIKSRDEAKSGNSVEVQTPGASMTASSRPSSEQTGSDSRDRLRLAQTPQGQTSSDVSVNKRNDQNLPQTSAGLSEIIVTAQKRSERLQDVPVPVTAVSADSLVQSNQVRLQDYYTRVPGLAITPDDTDGVGATTIVIRGITTGAYTTPTVGVTVDDVPFGSSTALGGGAAAPDIDPSDLTRVEVLRGPQGTLYGANSFGGLLKFVTIDPSTDALSGHFEADGSSVYNARDPGYGLRAGVNVPLGDTLAVRASAFTRDDPGYIDDVVTGRNDVNRTNTSGGRVAALWKAADTFSLKFSALVQHTKADGSSLSDPLLGDLKQAIVAGGSGYEKTVQAYSVTLRAKLGSFDLVSLTGYNTNKLDSRVDISTGIIGLLSQQYFDSPPFPAGLPSAYEAYQGEPDAHLSGAPIIEHNKTRKVTQEFRLSAPLGDHLDWLFGVFGTHEINDFAASLLATDPATGTVYGTWEKSDSYPTRYTEYAAFTDLTFHVTDRFDVQIGGRESRNQQSYSETIVGGPSVLELFALPSPIVESPIRTSDNSFTYLFTPQFKITPDMMAYARIASGYRPGGPNPLAFVYGYPSEFKPDKTKNYEIGFKADWLNHRLSVDSSVYYIDWKDIQLQLQAPANFYFANGSRAKSTGIELSTEVKPIAGLTLSAWIALNDAVLKEAFPSGSAAYGAAGDRLPYAARASGNFSLDWEYPITDSIAGFVGGSESYTGNRLGNFLGVDTTGVPLPRQQLPGFAQTDLRAGAKVEQWTLSLFANNVMDKRGQLGGGAGGFYPQAFTYIHPRTIGLSASRPF